MQLICSPLDAIHQLHQGILHSELNTGGSCVGVCLIPSAVCGPLNTSWAGTAAGSVADAGGGDATQLSCHSAKHNVVLQEGEGGEVFSDPVLPGGLHLRETTGDLNSPIILGRLPLLPQTRKIGRMSYHGAPLWMLCPNGTFPGHQDGLRMLWDTQSVDIAVAISLTRTTTGIIDVVHSLCQVALSHEQETVLCIVLGLCCT